MTHFVDEFRLKAAASAWQKREKRAVWVIER